MLNEARSNGMSGKGLTKLRQLFEKHRNTFRIKLGPDPPGKVRPLKITLINGTTPHRSPQRRYAPAQCAFINCTIKELETVGALYKNPNSKWASPALAVPIPGSDSLRFTVDLWGPSSKTQPIQSAILNFESLLQDCEGSKCFAKVDFCHGYWQLALENDSQEMMSIQTPCGIFSPTLVPQGGTDSGKHFQSVTSKKFELVVLNPIQ